MGATLHYGVQIPATLIGSKSGTTRTGVTLTAAYDALNTTKIFEVGGFSEIVMDVSYTTGASESSNSIEIRLEDSPDRTNWYRLSNEAASAGTSTLTQREFTFAGADAATEYAFSYRLDTSYRYMRISCKETGVSANYGTVYIEALLSG